MNELKKGFEFPAFKYELTQGIVDKYESAIEVQNPSVKYVPPLAIAAYAMKTMSESAVLPPGIIHTSQEFEFLKPVNTGATLECQAEIIQTINRGPVNIIVIEIKSIDETNEVVLRGKATALLPQEKTNK